MNQMEAFKMEQRRAAEATGVKTREREQAREQERDKPKEVEQRDTEREAAEREREKERASAAAEAAAREEQRADEEKREKELCELEKLVQEQARRAGLVLDPSEPLLETSSCIPEYATSGTISASSETASPDATDASPANGPSTSSTNSSIPATSSSTYAAPQLPRTDSSESIYAFIIRRLNALEGNSTLVARYIDEQSKALRAALSRAEARWEVARVQAVRDDEQRWEVERMRHEDRMGRVVSQMEAMRSAMESQRRLTESQLRLLADEIGFERRKSLAQLVILLAVLVLGLLTRSDMLDSIINALAENKRQHTRVRPSRHQRQLSTGPLAGLLIDVASPVPRTPVPSTPTIPTQPDANLRVSTGKPARRQLAPSASLRRRNTSNSRSFSAEPSLLMDLDLEDELTSPSRRSLVANPPRRRIARSAHLHPIRRRGDESSEAEGARTSEGGRVRLPPSPSPVPTPVSAPSGSAARSPHYLAFPPGPLTAPSTIVSGESTDVSAPGSTADSASADSASEVEDAVERVRSVSGSTVRFGMRLVDKFAAAGFGDDDDDVDAEVRSFRSVRSSKSMRRIERAREKEKEREKGKDREWTQDEKR
jgi:hypothetical protein